MPVLQHKKYDYYAFGSQMPGRKYTSGNRYRYGFNGKENDPENGNTQDYGMRIYDPRIAKFLSVDPLEKDYPWYTTYQFAGNTPIAAVDLDGEEEKTVVHHLDVHPDGTFFVVQTDVTIDKDKIFHAPSGTDYATTHVYYEYQGETVYGGVILEEIKPDGPMPSANYDYTIPENSEKFDDDWEYIGWNLSKINDVYKRDQNAPDNAITTQDLEALQVTPAGRLAPKGKGMELGARSKEAQKNAEKYKKKGVPESQLGPSGKPKVHTVNKKSKKEAKDAARNNPKSNSAPVKHTKDKGQKKHYHSTRDGEKMDKKDNTHYTYPSKENIKTNE